MKRTLAFLCSIAMMISTTVIGFNLTVSANDTPLSPNGQVAWVADFSADNLENWIIDAHTGTMENRLTNGNALFRDVANISENGLSATLQAKVADCCVLTGYKVEADFSTYNQLVMKGKYTGDINGAFRFSLHDGAHLNSNWGAYGESASVDQWICPTNNPGVNTDGTFFWVIDLNANFATASHMWFALGWFLNNTDTLAIDYAALTTDTVTDDATATAAISKYLAGEQYAPPQVASASDEKAFSEAVDTKQKFISGAMRIDLTASDFAKLQGCKNKLILTDGTNELTWDLADYTFAEGKINTMLFPFYEATNATAMATKLDLTAVTGVKLTASGHEGELEVSIGNVDFVNFDELLDSIGIVFYDSCNVMSTGIGVVPGEKGGAYYLSNDVDVGEYVTDGTAEWARRFGAKGEKFSFNASSRKKLDLTMRVNIEGGYNRFGFQLTSLRADDAYADQNWSIMFFPDDSIYHSEQSWFTISTADEDDTDAWSYGFDNVCDLTRLLQMRLLAFRQGNEGGNRGTVKVDYIMMTDMDRFEGIENLYLYATSNLDGSNRQSPYEKEEAPGNDDPIQGGDDPTQDNDSDNSNDKNDNDTTPDTGIAFPIAGLALLTLSAGCIGISRKKR